MGKNEDEIQVTQGKQNFKFRPAFIVSLVLYIILIVSLITTSTNLNELTNNNKVLSQSN